MTASRKAIWTSLLLVLVIVAYTVVANVGWDKAFGATPAAANAQTAPALLDAGTDADAETDAAPPIHCDPPYSTYECERSKYVRTKVTKFQAGTYGNSRGFEFSSKVKTMISRAYAASQTRPGPAGREDGDHWWMAPMHGFNCMAYGLNMGGLKTSDCDRSAREYETINENTQRVSILCGGAAVIGSLKGGGYWGAGKGASTCFFTQIFLAWWNSRE